MRVMPVFAMCECVCVSPEAEGLSLKASCSGEGVLCGSLV